MDGAALVLRLPLEQLDPARTAAVHEMETLDPTIRDVAMRHLSRACRELPAGPADEQLRNFCGRGWEFLHTPTYAALYRHWVAEAPDSDLARFCDVEVFAVFNRMLTRIIETGIATGIFRPVSALAAARLIQAALMQQAFWCTHSDALSLEPGRGCNRVVAETLSIVLGGLLRPRSMP